MAIHQDAGLAWLLAVSVPVLAVGNYLIVSRMLPIFRSMQQRIDAINRILREQLAGVRVVRAFGREPFEEQRFDAANHAGIWTGVCGEMAGDIRLTPLLLGLGVEELSVGPHQVPSVRRAIRALSHAECSAMADEAVRTPLSADIMESTLSLARKYYPELLD
jgi:ABC-type multidrug transport system fused ATPase/permease subunit